MRRAVLVAVLGLVTALAGAGPAAAYWQQGGAGTGQGPVATLTAGTQPGVSATSKTVTVQWAQTTFEGRALGGYAGGGYKVLRYPAGGGAAVTPGGACAGTVSGAGATLSCQEPDVPAGAWRYAVQPVLNSWTGPQSAASASVSVAPAAPSAAAAVAQNPAAGQATGDIRVSWPVTADADGYNVYRRTSSGAYDFTKPLNGTAPVTGTAYVDPGSGLTGGTTYRYVVRAVTQGAESADSDEASATAIARPPAPAAATATLAPAGRIDVSWPSVPGVVGYNVYRRLDTGAYDYSAPLNGPTPITGTTFADVATLDGTSYRYVVRAVVLGAGGAPVESVDSSQSAKATADATPPGGVAFADPGSFLRGTATLTGAATDSGSGIASLQFEYRPAGGTTWSTACTATVAPYACGFATTTVADGLYDLRVVATDLAGNATPSSVIVGRRIDNTGPTVAMGDPGAFIRGTVTLTATASDGGSGLADLRIQRAPTGTTTWTTVCTVTTGSASCPLNTATLADGGYDLRAVATDVAGNVTVSTVVNRVVDNTVPTGTDIQTTNVAGGIVGKPETGDTITYTFSEPMLPASILSGWTGAGTTVTVRFTNGNPDVVTIWDALGTRQLPLGSFTSGKKYVTANTDFKGSTMLLSGSSITITLGTPNGPTQEARGNGSTTLQWTTSAAATDRAGNALTAGTVAETGAADEDF